MAAKLAEDARAVRATNVSLAYELAVAAEKVEGVSLGFAPEELVPESPLPMLGHIEDRLARERFLEGLLSSRPEDGPRLVAEWFFREEDARTLDLIDRRLSEVDPPTREATLDKLLKSPRSGPKAFLWFGLRAAQDDSFRARLTPIVLGRLLDAASWDDLGGGRAKIRELFDRTGMAAAWLVKQATLEEAQQFLQALDRHNELEPHRRAALFSAAEMRFPDLRKGGDDYFFVTEEALEGKKKELEKLAHVDIPENTKGLALARAEGDLSENFEYQARKQRQQDLDVRVARLQEELRKARVLDPATVDLSEVRPGTRVTLRLLGGTRAVTLLGPWDSRPEADVYSYLADVSKGLLGRKVGDRVSFLGDEGSSTPSKSGKRGKRERPGRRAARRWTGENGVGSGRPFRTGSGLDFLLYAAGRLSRKSLREPLVAGFVAFAVAVASVSAEACRSARGRFPHGEGPLAVAAPVRLTERST